MQLSFNFLPTLYQLLPRYRGHMLGVHIVGEQVVISIGPFACDVTHEFGGGGGGGATLKMA